MFYLIRLSIRVHQSDRRFPSPLSRQRYLRRTTPEPSTLYIRLKPMSVKENLSTTVQTRSGYRALRPLIRFSFSWNSCASPLESPPSVSCFRSCVTDASCSFISASSGPENVSPVNV